MALTEAASPSGASCISPNNMDWILHTVPTNNLKAEMRMASKPPSEWLHLLCKGWAEQNQEIVAATDYLLTCYKPYLGGLLTSQLLCRLSIYGRETLEFPWMEGNSPPSFDFWKLLGVFDEFDRAHIVANIERFCSLYDICGGEPNNNVSPTNAAFSPIRNDSSPTSKSDARKLSPDNVKKIQQRRLMKEREKEAIATRKAAEKAARAASREEKRQKKMDAQKQRAENMKIQREMAFKRLAELVHSDNLPTEITGGFNAVAAKTVPALPKPTIAVPALVPATAATRKNRSAIIISTAADLDQIVTYSNSLWSKYNAVAKEHNKRVKWQMVAKELGINVKVREKYARMHARAKMRGFDFVNWGHYRIKDFPQYFLDPLQPIGGAASPTGTGQEAFTSAEAGGSYSESAEETDEAIFHLAMEVAEAGGYSSDPAPEHLAAMEASDYHEEFAPFPSTGAQCGV